MRRSFAQLVLAAALAACGGDIPESSGSTPPDSVPGGIPAVTEAGAVDTSVTPEPSTGPEPDARLLTADGWGPLRIGMSREDVVEAAGEDANPDAVGGPDPQQCDEFRPADAPPGVLVMIERGTLTRISVSRNTDIATPAGFHVGDAGSAVEDGYGARAVVEPHQYQEAPARYITVWRDGAERRGIRYEVGPDGAIVHMRAGGPSIEYVEGCV